jgi:UDP-N-acetylmuramoyl-tripeptide--D-alanyl-D-alanine ligase
MQSKVYSDIQGWKKPLHVLRARLAKQYLNLLPSVQVIGITGSVGKTLTQNAVFKVLSQKYKCVAGEENLDPTFRIPRTVLKLKPWHKFLILEYGVEHPGDMDYYLSIVKPNLAAVTNIAETHTKYFKDTAGVFHEKSKLVKSLPASGYAILNADDPESAKLHEETKATVIWVGKNSKKGVKISNFKQNLNGASFRLHYRGQIAHVSWKIIGAHQQLAAHIAATIGILNGMTLKQIATGLSMVKPPMHRLSQIVTKHVNIIDDTYNSSPKAAVESINTLRAVGKGLEKIAVLGEMKDLGEISVQAHKLVGETVAKSKINVLITVGNAAKDIAKAAKKKSFKGKIINVTSTKEALRESKKYAGRKSIILVKGSRHTHLERVVFGLLHKSTHITCYHCGKLK